MAAQLYAPTLLLWLSCLWLASCQPEPIAFVGEDVPDSLIIRYLPEGPRIKRGETLHLAAWAQQAPTATYLLLPAIPLLDSLLATQPFHYQWDTIGTLRYTLVYSPKRQTGDTLRVAVRHAKCAAWAAWERIGPQLANQGKPVAPVVCYQPGEARALLASGLVHAAVLQAAEGQGDTAFSVAFPLLLGTKRP